MICWKLSQSSNWCLATLYGLCTTAGIYVTCIESFDGLFVCWPKSDRKKTFSVRSLPSHLWRLYVKILTTLLADCALLHADMWLTNIKPKKNFFAHSPSQAATLPHWGHGRVTATGIHLTHMRVFPRAFVNHGMTCNCFFNTLAVRSLPLHCDVCTSGVSPGLWLNVRSNKWSTGKKKKTALQVSYICTLIQSSCCGPTCWGHGRHTVAGIHSTRHEG